MKEREVTLTFLVRDKEICLAPKKNGRIGVGYLNGYGGGLEDGETVKKAAVREMLEESEVCVDEADLYKRAEIRFYFAGVPKIYCHIFIVNKWQGDPVETSEMGKPEWFSQDALPIDSMWVNDREWLPMVLQGKGFKGEVFFSEDGKQVLDFRFEDAIFS